MKSKSILVSASSLVTPVLASVLLLMSCANNSDKLAPVEPQPTAKPSKPSEASETADVDPAPLAEAPRAVIGDSAPEFRLVDQHGKRVALSEIRGESNVAIVFHRSAVW